MKIITILFLILPTTTANASESLQKGSFESGLFQSLRYGFSNDLEISTHPIFAFVIPNIAVQKHYLHWNNISVSSRHTLVIPTPLLRLVSKKGIGGFISPEFEIPFMIAFKNEIGLNKEICKNWKTTGRAGITLAYLSEELDERTTIDLPIIFSRMGVFYNGFGVNFSVDLNGTISSNISIYTDFNVLMLPGADEDLALEHKSLLTWKSSERTRYQIGYKLVYGEYPFGSMWHFLPVPLFDIIWSW